MKNERNIKRGQVYYISSIYDTIGSEQRSGRPAIIVSNNDNNKHSDCVEIVYLTLKEKTALPTHVFIKEGVLYNSTALCEQVTSVSVKRLGDLMCTLDKETMQKIDKALACSLNLEILNQDIAESISHTEFSSKAEITALKHELDNMSVAYAEADRKLNEALIYKRMYEELITSLTKR